MKLFITHTYKGIENKAEVEELCQIVKDSGWEDYSFIRDVENYQKIFNSSKEMMLSAQKSISECDALLFDMTDPSIGKGIEAGMARALGKKIIVIYQLGVEKRNTILGIADLAIEYHQIEDIKAPLARYLADINSKST